MREEKDDDRMGTRGDDYSPPRCGHYPLRIMARVFAFLGLAAVVYSVVLIEMNFQSQIIAF